MKPNMSIYYIIGVNPNEYFDAFRIESYYAISNSLVLNSISNLFYDIGDSSNNRFQILAIGQKKDYMMFQQTNNTFYYQLGNTKNDFYKISSSQFIHFHLFLSISHLFSVLIDKIENDKSDQILIILQNHEELYSFKNYDYIFLLKSISTIEVAKDIFIYDESCYNGSLVELFEYNNAVFNYFQKTGKINDQTVSSLYYISLLQNLIYQDFGDHFTIFLQEAFNFISKISLNSFDFFFSSEFINLKNKILQSINQNYTDERTEIFFSNSN